MTLTYFCDSDTYLKENFQKAIILATLSCTVIQLGMALCVDGICDLDLHKKGQNALTYFSVPVC